MAGVNAPNADDPGSDLGTGRATAGLSVVSAGILLLEVGSTRLLSFVSWHHFAFMVVSVAMLGLGAASVALTLSKRLRSMSLARLCTIGSTAQAVFTVVAYAVLVTARFSPILLAQELVGQLACLAATYLALVLPFLAGGVVMASCLSRLARRASTLYGGDLIGAAVGSLAAVVLAGPLSVEQVVLLSGLLAGIGASIFAWGSRPRTGLAVLVALGVGACGVIAPIALPARPARGKSMQQVLEDADRPGVVVTSVNTPLGRIDVIDTWEEVVWSRNTRAPEDRPPQLRIVIDGDAATPVALVDDSAPEGLEYLDALPSSFVFELRRPERALILGAGGGQDVLSALRSGTREIDAVEINPAIVRLMTSTLSARSGHVYERRGVRLINAEGRSFVRGARERYDVVQMGLVDTWAATAAGGMSLTENFLYTVDAFQDYLGALREGGMIGITRWIQTPERETLRLTVLAAEALERSGRTGVEQHLAVVGVDRVGALIVSREPLSGEDVERISALARERRLDVLWLPGRRPESPTAEVFHELLTSEDRDVVVARYPFDITPVSDDRPFFFDFNTLRGQARWAMLVQPSVAVLSGTATIAAILAQAIVLSLALLCLPLLLRRTRIGRSGAGLLAYFAATGTGFMFIEVPLLQRLTLLVGHPTQATALVLGVLLGSCGLASLRSERITASSRRRAVLALGSLAVLAALEAIFGIRIAQDALTESMPVRILCAVALVFPLGALMGLATPHGLRVASATRPDITPLLWATTSFASVVGAVLSVFVSMQMGFGAALGVGAACYAIAALLAPGR